MDRPYTLDLGDPRIPAQLYKRLANGDLVPVGDSYPLPGLYLPRLPIVTATAMTRPNNTTPYAANDAVSNNATAASVAAIAFAISDLADAPLLLPRARLFTTDTGPGTAGATFELFLFSADPAANSGVGGGDNAAWSQKMTSAIGKMTGTFEPALDGSFAVLVPSVANFIEAKPVSGGVTVYGLLKTLTAFTPSASSSPFTATLEGIQGRA
jgi:hypothetical protein